MWYTDSLRQATDLLRSRSVIDRLPQSPTVFYPDGLSTPTSCDSGHTTHAT
ncbi:hypothetical protein B5X24_HaOG216205 [Helicoverpa armigera]|nr:hypothetical protein B5X24_HaOG216205 [Helicoverpa armigera]